MIRSLRIVRVVVLLVGVGMYSGCGGGVPVPVPPDDTQYALTADVQGSGTVDPANGSYAASSDVTVTATPAWGWTFSQWQGDAAGTDNPMQIMMDADKTVTAVFIEQPVPDQYNLAVSVQGQGSVNPLTGTYDGGSVVALTATPADGWLFVQWQGDAAGTDNPLQITVDANTTITAVFEPNYSLAGTWRASFLIGELIIDASGTPVSMVINDVNYILDGQEHQSQYGAYVLTGQATLSGTTVEIVMDGTIGVNPIRLDIQGEFVSVNTIAGTTMTNSDEANKTNIVLVRASAENIESTISAQGYRFVRGYNYSTSADDSEGTLTRGDMVAIDAWGNIYTASESSHINKYGSDGSKHWTYDSGAASGAAVDGAGNVFIAHGAAGQKITKLDSSGTYLTEWGTGGTGVGEFDTPSGIAVDADGDVYVVDKGNARIQKFTNTGTFVTTWGSAGSGDGQFDGPTDVAVDADGNVYVSDTGNNRIQKFTADGSFITKWGTQGTGDGEFDPPSSIATGPQGNVYVSDAGNKRVQKFSGTGTFITKWVSSLPINIDAENIGAVGVDSGGNVYIEHSLALIRILKFALIDRPDNDRYSLSTGVVGQGSVDPVSDEYDFGTEVAITATPQEGWFFVGWTGSLGGRDAATTIVIDSEKVVTAVFVQHYTLTVNVVGDGGVSPGSGNYDPFTDLDLTAVADAGWTFWRWEDGATGSDPAAAITMDQDRMVTAVFTDTVSNPKVLITTSMGDILLELNRTAAPHTVANFLRYVREGFFDNGDGKGATIFHRVISDFMIQGGGFTAGLTLKDTHDPVVNEASNGLKNDRGTIVMARTDDPDSATAQFFINLVDNGFLNYVSDASPGYTVFGAVIQGLDVLDAIGAVETSTQAGMGDVPVQTVTITSVTIIP